MRRTALAVVMVVMMVFGWRGSVSIAAPTPPVDDKKAAAQESYDAGMTEYILGHYDDAIRSWETGFRLSMRPQFLYNIAQAHRKAGRTAPALEFYRRYLQLAPAAENRGAVETAIAELQATLDKPAAPVATAPAATPAPAGGPTAGPTAAAGGPAASSAATSPSASATPTASVPAAALAADGAAPPSSAARNAWWPWVVGVGAVVVGGAVAVGVAYAIPRDATDPGSPLGSMTLQFH